nr:reverse transcriptase domain-containing protein [Tanacetum cinerariifolium]
MKTDPKASNVIKEPTNVVYSYEPAVGVVSMATNSYMMSISDGTVPSLGGATVGQTQNVYAAGAYQGNSYKPQGNRNLLSYRSDNYLRPPGFNQNQNRNNQNQNFQNQNRNQGNHNPQGNNQVRNQFFQGASHGQNPPPAFQAPAYQASVYQALVHQPQIPQPQVITTNEFTNFMKANNVILKNMQTNMTSLTNINLKLKNMFGQFMKMNTALSLGLRTLSGNIITNLKEELKGITTRSGTAYQGPTIPTTSSSLPLVVERETGATKDTVHPTNNESTKDVQPLVVQSESTILNSEPDIAPIIEPIATSVSALKPNQRPLNPYPSRLHDQKLRDKANDQREKIFQIFKDLNFNISIFVQDNMSRDVLTVGSTMRIPLLYRGEYSQWVERFMNYLEEQMDREAMINSINNGDQPLPRVTQVSIAGTSSTEQPHLKDKPMWHMLGSEYDEHDRKATVLYEYETFKATYETMMRQNKNLMDINIDSLYNILKQNQGDINDAMGSKKKTVVVTFGPLALIAEKTKVSKSKEKVVISSNSEGTEADDFYELKKITALLAKAFNRRKFYFKPTN